MAAQSGASLLLLPHLAERAGLASGAFGAAPAALLTRPPNLLGSEQFSIELLRSAPAPVVEGPEPVDADSNPVAPHGDPRHTPGRTPA